jgi:hypothetical protein
MFLVKIRKTLVVYGGLYILLEIGHLFFAQSGEKVLLNRGRKLHN